MSTTPVLAETPADLKALLMPGQRLLGIDLGEKTLGLAISDPRLVLASPRQTLRRGRLRDDAAKLAAMVAADAIGGVVIGLPVNMDGSEGPRCQASRAFAGNLYAILGLPTLLWDERLSTRAVERLMIEQGDVSRRRRAAAVDSLAAAYIL
ncbi:MAG: Holliday junction resolvase RuvX, partial [Alphaproteobacteria bacterium]